MNCHATKTNFLTGFLCLIMLTSYAQTHVNDLAENGRPKLDNPISVQYLRKHLNKKSPRLLLTPAIEKRFKQKLKSDPLTQNFYKYLYKEATLILDKPLLQRELQGFRLLAVSRAMLVRMGILCMIYRMDRRPEILTRIDAELSSLRLQGLEPTTLSGCG